MKLIVVAIALTATAAVAKDKEPRKLTPLEEMLEHQRAHPQVAASPGSLYEESGRFADLARDQRAARVGDLVTIVVSDRASAVSRGATSANRKSEVNASVTALGGPTRVAGPLSALAQMGSDSKLDGAGETSRESSLTTTLSAYVKQVMPNGNLLLEGSKDVMVNSERQKVIVRGLVRWNDLSPANRVASDRLAALEVQIQGKGVVQDAIRRPNILYRILLGILPF
jgi:flagellar L-ring protein precursor FlgH